MRVCIVGNSHIAAMKRAVDNGALRDENDVDIVFFGAPGSRFKKIRFQDGVISGPPTLDNIFLQVSGGRYKKIVAEEFDVVVVYGGSLFFHKLIESLHQAVFRDEVFLSESFLERGIERWFTTKLAFKIANEVSKTSARSVLMPRPIPAISLEDVDERKREGARDAGASGREASLKFRKDLFSLARAIIKKHDIDLLLQPERTLTQDLSHTLPEYSVGSTRLLGHDRKHDNEDASHMNAHFGEVILHHMLDFLRA